MLDKSQFQVNNNPTRSQKATEYLHKEPSKLSNQSLIRTQPMFHKHSHSLFLESLVEGMQLHKMKNTRNHHQR